MNGKQLIWIASTIISVGCSNFPEQYENVIKEKKIRPFAMVLEPAEAAPGDTVEVSLHIYDACKNYEVEWTLQLGYKNEWKTAMAEKRITLDLDSMRIPASRQNADSRLQFRFVLPEGDLNPLRNPLIPRIQIPAEDLNDEIMAILRLLEIKVSNDGVEREAIVRYFEQSHFLPQEVAELADEMFSLVNLQAKIRSGGFELDVEKRLTVRYSNRLEELHRPSNVNKNPRLDSIGIITVHKKGIEDPGEIHRYESDTAWFSMNAFNFYESPDVIVDTIGIRKENSYFLIADTAGAAQEYYSAEDTEVVGYREQLFYQWFYTNLDDTGSDWKDLIEVVEGKPGCPLAWLKVPSNQRMKNFAIYVTVGDVRWEWAGRNSAGMAYLKARGYFKYN